MKESEAIWIGIDHGGYEPKRQIVEYLNGKGVPVVHNVGSDSVEIVRYPYYAVEVASAVSRGEARRDLDSSGLVSKTGEYLKEIDPDRDSDADAYRN